MEEAVWEKGTDRKVPEGNIQAESADGAGLWLDLFAFQQVGHRSQPISQRPLWLGHWGLYHFKQEKTNASH